MVVTQKLLKNFVNILVLLEMENIKFQHVSKQFMKLKNVECLFYQKLIIGLKKL